MEKKSPFDHPFFTDNDNYMKKSQRNFFIWFAVYAVVMFGSFMFLLSYLGNQVHEAGGPAKIIGGFIKDVKEASH